MLQWLKTSAFGSEGPRFVSKQQPLCSCIQVTQAFQRIKLDFNFYCLLNDTLKKAMAP